MQHLIFHKEPRIGEMFGERNRWQIVGVTHHGGTQRYKIEARERFAQGDYRRNFSGEIRA